MSGRAPPARSGTSVVVPLVGPDTTAGPTGELPAPLAAPSARAAVILGPAAVSAPSPRPAAFSAPPAAASPVVGIVVDRSSVEVSP